MNTPNHENIDYWLFDQIEGNLSAEQEEQLKLFLLLNPEYDHDADAWNKTQVTFQEVDPIWVEEMQFGVKEEDRKRRKLPLWAWWAVGTPMVLGFLIYTLVGLSTPIQTAHKSNSRNLILNKTNSSGRNNIKYGTYAPLLAAAKPHNREINLESQDNLNLSQALLPTIHILNTSIKHQQPDFLKLLPIKSVANKNYISEQKQEDINEAKKQLSLKLPKLQIRKSSLVGKYLNKEVVNASRKDRYFVAQEKSHLDINEAFVGNMSQTRVQSTSIARWLGSQDQKLTQQLSIDGYSRNLKSGFGLVSNFSDYGKGTIKDWNVKLIYSPKIAFNKFISAEPSLSYYFGQKSINPSKVVNHNYFEFQSNQLQQYNYHSTDPIGKSLYYRDLNAGLVLNLGPIYLGVSSNNLLKHQDNIHTNDFDTLDRASQTQSLMIGTDFSANNGNIKFSPMFYCEKIGSKTITQFSGTLQVKSFVLGGNYGSNNSFGGLLGFHSENFTILAQSFKTQGLLSPQPSYIHQLTLRINSNISRKTRRYLYL